MRKKSQTKIREKARNRIGKISLFLPLLLLILPLLSPAFVHADTYNADQNGSIQAVLVSQPDSKGKNISYTDVSMKLYRVGIVSEQNGTAVFTLDSRFASSGIKMETLVTAEQWASAASTLAQFLQAGKIQITGIEAISNAQAELSYSNLTQGIYLLVQNSAQNRITIAPSLHTIPMQEDGRWIYDLKVYPKFNRINIRTDTNIETNTIIKTGTAKTLYSTNTARTVKTGDTTSLISWILLLAAALAVLAIVYKIRRKRR